MGKYVKQFKSFSGSDVKYLLTSLMSAAFRSIFPGNIALISCFTKTELGPAPVSAPVEREQMQAVDVYF